MTAERKEKTMNVYHDVYQEMVDAGVPVDSHESDLYVPVTEASTAVLKRTGWTYVTFTSTVDARPWYDIAFGYRPWWDARKK